MVIIFDRTSRACLLIAGRKQYNKQAMLGSVSACIKPIARELACLVDKQIAMTQLFAMDVKSTEQTNK